MAFVAYLRIWRTDGRCADRKARLRDILCSRVAHPDHRPSPSGPGSLAGIAAATRPGRGDCGKRCRRIEALRVAAGVLTVTSFSVS